MKTLHTSVLTLCLLILIVSTSSAQTTPQITFLSADARSADNWNLVRQQLAEIGIDKVSLECVGKEDESTNDDSRINSNRLYIGASQHGLIVSSGESKASLSAVKKIVTDDISSEEEMHNTINLAKQSYGFPKTGKVSIDENGFIKLSSDTWAAMTNLDPKDKFSDPTWVLLTTNSNALTKQNQKLAHVSIGAIIIEVLQGSQQSKMQPNAIAQLIAERVNFPTNVVSNENF